MDKNLLYWRVETQSSNGPNFKGMAKTKLKEINQTIPWIIYMPGFSQLEFWTASFIPWHHCSSATPHKIQSK